VKPELSDALVNSIERAMQAGGARNLDEGLVVMHVCLDYVQQSVAGARTRADMIAMCGQFELPDEQARMFIAAVDAMPMVLQSGLDAFRQAAVQTMEAPRIVGRKRSLDVAQQAEVCSFIGTLFGQGVPLKLCQLRASQRFGVSRRTVERAWQQRAQLAQQATVNKPDPVTALKWLRAQFNF
jgi:hypothetical protein